MAIRAMHGVVATIAVITFVLISGPAAWAVAWQTLDQTAGVGWEGQGAGMAVGDITGDLLPELFVMAYDNPVGENTFRYKMARNFTTFQGESSPPLRMWGPICPPVPGVGWEANGAGMALVDLDGDGRLELIVAAYDNPAGANQFKYRVLSNLDTTTGCAGNIGPIIDGPSFGETAGGANILVTDIDGDGHPDLVFMAFHNDRLDYSPFVASRDFTTFRIQYYFNLNGYGKADHFSPMYEVPGVQIPSDGSTMVLGSGAAAVLVDKEGGPGKELVLLVYDRGEFRSRTLFPLDASGRPSPFGFPAARWDAVWNFWNGQEVTTLPGVGAYAQGIAAVTYDFNGNKNPDLLLMTYDNPDRDNTFRFRVGYDLK